MRGLGFPNRLLIARRQALSRYRQPPFPQSAPSLYRPDEAFHLSFSPASPKLPRTGSAQLPQRLRIGRRSLPIEETVN